MKLIELTRGYSTMIDDADFEMVSKSKWYYGGRGYAVRSHGKGHERVTLMLHRLLLGLVPGDERQADHVNGDKLDNRRINLRVCTQAENLRNCGLRADNISGLKGVFFKKDKIYKNPWVAQIRKGGKQHHIGVFATKEEAALAYDTAAKKLHGTFARLNDCR